MPPRIFRYSIRNSTAEHDLHLVAAHLCWGDWTPRWEPPATITSGSSGSFQGESGTLVTGTEGWTKYSVTRRGAAGPRAMIYMYWNNPYFGATRGKGILVGEDISPPDCDGDGYGAVSGGSTFQPVAGSNEPPSDLRLALTQTRRDGSPTTVDEVGDLYRIPLAPIFIFGAGAIWERMEADFELRTVSLPPFLPPTSPAEWIYVARRVPEGKEDEWVGRWSSDLVSVDIHLARPHGLSVTVEDRTPGWQGKFTTTCKPFPGIWTLSGARSPAHVIPSPGTVISMWNVKQDGQLRSIVLRYQRKSLRDQSLIVDRYLEYFDPGIH